MKRIFTLLLILASTNIYALPCPTNSHIIYKGESLDHIRKFCGEPSAINTYQKSVNNLQKWVYYRPAIDQKNAKIALLFRNQQVANIEIADIQNLTETTLCGIVIRVGLSASSVARACGKPLIQKEIQNETITVTELKYQHPTAETLLFENGSFTDWHN